ncbi:MAG: hypothetical protein RMM17_10950 [Acidobacteriota bacterium]|nr:hypothetical protein [Blastocatellia bacterium]MDW8413189.1 hypothetical protein [Acidobacteriota bacterium]
MTVYFPQNDGDYRVYVKGRARGLNATWTDSVKQVADGYVHTNYWGDGIERRVSVDADGNVREGKALWYRLSQGAVAWQLQLEVDGPPCVDGSQVRIVSDDETVEVPAGKFENCLLLEFENNCLDAGVLKQWFAPGVGLVKQLEDSIAGPVAVELTSAVVGGVKYPKE